MTPTVLGFGYGSSTRIDYHELIAPHWTFLIAAGCLAVALKPAVRLKFNLRDLMILTTLVAVMAGALAALGRRAI